MGFSTSLSGLFANQQKLSVIGNNLANLNTIGFKASSVQFLDLVSQSVGGSSRNPMQVGLGVTVGSIAPNFRQGGIETTGIATNVAIQGSGFFVIGSANERSYTRAGDFSFDANGVLVAPDGQPVQGYTTIDPATGRVITTGPPGNIVIPPGVLRPPVATTTFSTNTNLNAGSAVGATFNPATSKDGWFGMPDNCAVDSLGRLWISEWNAGKVGMYDPAKNQWKEWRASGEGPKIYSIFVDEKDQVWVSDFGANAFMRFNPAKETFEVIPIPSPGAAVRQMLGRPGEAVTDRDGRFEWKPDPVPPFEVLVILANGTYARPVVIDRLDGTTEVTITITALVSEGLTVTGSAPGIESTPAAGTTTLSGRDVNVRQPANLMQAIENVAGVNQVSEGQAAVPAVRGLARGRTVIVIDGARVTSERRAGPSATYLDPSIVDGVDVARGPGSVAAASSFSRRSNEPRRPPRFRCRSCTGRTLCATDARRCCSTATAPMAMQCRLRSTPTACRWWIAASSMPSPISAAARTRAGAGISTASARRRPTRSTISPPRAAR